MFGKFLKKKSTNAVNAAINSANRDQMQALIAGALLVASADGQIEKEETDALDNILRAMPEMAHFGSEITSTISRFTSMLAAGGTSARVQIMREIRDIKGSPEEKEMVFAAIVDIAKSDGQIEDAEKRELIKIANEYGLRPSDYGVE